MIYSPSKKMTYWGFIRKVKIRMSAAGEAGVGGKEVVLGDMHWRQP